MTCLEAGLDLDRAWSLTPVELKLVVKAFNRRVRRQQVQFAALQANLMNYMRKCMGAKGSKVTVNQLLGGRSFDPGMTRQEITEYFRQRGKEIGK